MKKLIVGFCMIFSFAAQAHMDADPKGTSPSESEVNTARSCFEELDTLGCGSPKADYAHFRVCMHDVFPTLTPGCKKIVTELYGKRKK
jgi:hypothetical protein